MKRSKLNGFFYCVRQPNGFFPIWNATYYRKDAILKCVDWQTYGDNRPTWEELKKKGFRCEKLKIEKY